MGLRFTEKDVANYLVRRGAVVSRETLDTSDRPFALPPDVVLDLPVPPSVNRTRRVDWKGKRQTGKWSKSADKFVMLARTKRRDMFDLKLSRFEVHVVLSEDHTGIDLDNSIKELVDYLCRAGLIENDAPKNMRKITAEWGHAPEGCRVTLKAVAA